MLLHLAMKVLRHALKSDPSYYIGWKANIAMAFYDVASKHGWNKDKIHEDADAAADNFLQMLIK